MSLEGALDLDVPDLIEPIEAWRAWRVITHGGRFGLGSIVQPTCVPTSREAGRVLGQVHLCGTVIECERGFRAGHAYPSRIYVPVEQSDAPAHRRNGATCDELVHGLADYGVPVELVPGGRLDAIEALRQTASPS